MLVPKYLRPHTSIYNFFSSALHEQNESTSSALQSSPTRASSSASWGALTSSSSSSVSSSACSAVSAALETQPRLTLDAALRALVVDGLLARPPLEKQRLTEPSHFRFVTQGICFVEELQTDDLSSSSSSSSQPPQFVLSCKEPLVLSAITRCLGPNALLSEFVNDLQRHRQFYGSQDPGKGIPFQWMTAAELQARAQEGQTLRKMLSDWMGESETKKLLQIPELKYLSLHVDEQVNLVTLARDADGFALPRLVAQDESVVLTLVNQGRMEYYLHMGSVSVSAAVKFYSRSVRSVQLDNQLSSNMSYAYCKKPSKKELECVEEKSITLNTVSGFEKQRRAYVKAVQSRDARFCSWMILNIFLASRFVFSSSPSLLSPPHTSTPPTLFVCRCLLSLTLYHLHSVSAGFVYGRLNAGSPIPSVRLVFYLPTLPKRLSQWSVKPVPHVYGGQMRTDVILRFDVRTISKFFRYPSVVRAVTDFFDKQ